MADIQAWGDDLHMFGDGELDYVVARHNLEHYVDVVRIFVDEVRRPCSESASGTGTTA